MYNKATAAKQARRLLGRLNGAAEPQTICRNRNCQQFIFLYNEKINVYLHLPWFSIPQDNDAEEQEDLK